MTDYTSTGWSQFQPARFTVNPASGGEPQSMNPGMVPGLSVPPGTFGMPQPIPDPLLDFSGPVLRPEGVTRGLMLDPTVERATQRFVVDILTSDNEAILRQALVRYMGEAGFDSTQRRAIMQRALSLYGERGVASGNAERIRNRARSLFPETVPMGADMIKSEERFHIVVDELEKASPRGGKYHARVTSNDGRHRYFYNEDAFKASKHAPVIGSQVLRDRLRQDILDRVSAAGTPQADLAALNDRYDPKMVAELVREMTASGQLAVEGNRLRKPGARVLERPETYRTSINAAKDGSLARTAGGR